MARTFLSSQLLRQLSQFSSLSHKRRKFLKLATFFGGSAIATLYLSKTSITLGETPPEIAIIGGGIAGLTAAYYLKKQGIPFHLYEASSRLGGRIKTVETSQGMKEWGAEFVNSDHEDIINLTQALGINLINRKAQRVNSEIPLVGYYFREKIWTENQLAEMLIPLARQIGEDAAFLEENNPQVIAQLDNFSVSEYLIKHSDKITHPMVQDLIEGLIRVEYGVEALESSVLQLLYSLPTVKNNQVEVLGNSDELYRIEGGSSQLIKQLVNNLDPKQITINQPLKTITKQDKKLVLTFNNFQKSVDYIILSIPNTALRNIQINLSLSTNLQRFIKEVSLGTNQKIFAGFNSPLWQQEKGFSQEAWTDIGASEIWEFSPKQLTFYLGGEEVINTKGNSDQSEQTILNQLNSYLTGIKEDFQGKFIRTQWQKEPFIQGSYTSFQPNQLTQFFDCFYIESEQVNERQFVTEEQLIFAGEQFSSNYYGYMNGGAQTGRLAVQYLLEHLQKMMIPY